MAEARLANTEGDSLVIVDHQLPFLKCSRVMYQYQMKTKSYIFKNSEYFDNMEIKRYEETILANSIEFLDITENSPKNEGEMEILGWVDNNRKNSILFPVLNETRSLTVRYRSLSVPIVYNSSAKVCDLVHFFYQLLTHIGVFKDTLHSSEWTHYTLKLFDSNKKTKILRGSSLVWGMLHYETVLYFERLITNGFQTMPLLCDKEIMKSEREILCCVMVQNTQVFEIHILSNLSCLELKKTIMKLGELFDDSLTLYKRYGLYNLVEMSLDKSVSEYITDDILCVDLAKKTFDSFLMAGQISTLSQVTQKVFVEVNVLLFDPTNTHHIICSVINTFNVCLTTTLTIKDIVNKLSNYNINLFKESHGSIEYTTNYDVLICDSDIEKLHITLVW
ncbi:myotubularin, putative, partial [Entamoeba invadens IP1]